MAKKAKNSKKVGRNAEYCKAYRLSGKHEASQARQLKRHLALHPNDNGARAIFESFPVTVQKRA